MTVVIECIKKNILYQMLLKWYFLMEFRYFLMEVFQEYHTYVFAHIVLGFPTISPDKGSWQTNDY